MEERVSMRKDAEQIVIKNINAANPASDRDDGERTGGGEAVCSPAGFTGREQGKTASGDGGVSGSSKDRIF